jgi:hypothetical protein
VVHSRTSAPGALRKFDAAEERTTGRSRATALVLFLGVAAVGCDKGKAPYSEGVDLEEHGKLQEAADKYDSVCKRAPDSKLCPPSIERAAAVRLKLADTAISANKFEDAEKTLKIVADSGDDASKKKASATLLAKPMTFGLQWEKAFKLADKRAALGPMETVATSDTPIASKATEWLQKERPALLLADVRAACAPKYTDACPTACDKLIKLHADTPEGKEAATTRTAYDAEVAKLKAEQEVAEGKRLYPLLVKVEALLARAKKVWQDGKDHDACYLRMLAADPDNAFAALSACGEVDTKKSDKVKTAWDDLLKEINTPALEAGLNARWKKARDDCDYTKIVPAVPAGLTALDPDKEAVP